MPEQQSGLLRLQYDRTKMLSQCNTPRATIDLHPVVDDEPKLNL